MNKPKRRRLGLPSRWLYCPRIGKPVNDLFVPFKTPLDTKFDAEISPSCQFSLDTLLSMKTTEKIGLIINLTKTERYYKADELNGIKQFKSIPCEGHDGPPTKDQVLKFIETCSMFFDNNNKESFVGVHCTHGFNRTGFMIVSYLYEKCDVELDTAVELFAKARPPGIYKQDYLDELSIRCDYDGDKLIADCPPNWDNQQDEEDETNIPESLDILPDTSESDSDNLDDVKNDDLFKVKPDKTSKKKRKTYVVPKIAAFMDGVGGVSVVHDTTVMEEVQQKVRDLMDSTRYGFVGSQPVSMTMTNIKLLMCKKYMMSWKADGTRYLMLIADRDLVYMLDRDNCVYKVNNINFPKDNVEHHSNTLVDGEMVIDVFGDQKFPRFLIYDIMAIDDEYVGYLDFPRRLNIIKTRIIDARNKFVTPNLKKHESFGVRIKDFWPIDKTQEIWEGKFRQQLCHQMDGLIFQPADEPYVSGKCISILKWKPPELNSIDFRLVCNYEKEKDSVPRFVGYLYVTGETRPFGTIERIKKDLREIYDNKIVECTLDRATLQWNILRERTDKSVPNHITTAASVIESINNPVNIVDVYKTIRYARNRGTFERSSIL